MAGNRNLDPLYAGTFLCSRSTMATPNVSAMADRLLEVQYLKMNLGAKILPFDSSFINRMSEEEYYSLKPKWHKTPLLNFK